MEKAQEPPPGFRIEDVEALDPQFEAIAAQWPHYIIPSGHAFAPPLAILLPKPEFSGSDNRE